MLFQNGEKNFTCELCNFYFVTALSLLSIISIIQLELMQYDVYESDLTDRKWTGQLLQSVAMCLSFHCSCWFVSLKERCEISDVRIFTHSVRAFRAKVSYLTSQLPSMSEGGWGRVGRLTDPPGQRDMGASTRSEAGGAPGSRRSPAAPCSLGGRVA